MPLAGLVVAAAPQAEILRACGPDPRVVCQRVLDWTGSDALAQFTDWIVRTPLKIGIVLIGAVILTAVLRRVIHRFATRLRSATTTMKRRRPASISESEAAARLENRVTTLSTALVSVASIIVWTIAMLTVLGELDVNLGPLIAGAGIAGVALGFGAQSLVRDFLAGVFILVEDQYGVGDLVDVGPASGTVERVTLRVTRLRDEEGVIWYVPNGEIRRVGNSSQRAGGEPDETEVRGEPTD